MNALVQGRIGIALRFGSGVDGTQAMQLSASARVIAAGLSRAPHKAGKSGIIEREHAPQCLARSRRDRTMRCGFGLTILVACLERALNAGAELAVHRQQFSMGPRGQLVAGLTRRRHERAAATAEMP